MVFVYGVLILCLWRINRYPDRHLPVALPVGACAVTLAAAVLFTVYQAQRHDLTFRLLDVGQGQCVVVTSGSARAMIDCGGTKDPGGTPQPPTSSPWAAAGWTC